MEKKNNFIKLKRNLQHLREMNYFIKRDNLDFPAIANATLYIDYEQ